MTAATVTKFPEKSPYQPDTAEGILRAYDAFVADIDDQPQWLLDLRKSSLKEFKRRGIPTPRIEGWKFTNLLPLVKTYGDKVGQIKVSHDKVDDVVITPLMQMLDADWVKAALSEDMPPLQHNTENTLWHLGNIYMRDGIVIDVPANKEISKPLELLTSAADGAFFTDRMVIRVQKNARLTIVEDHWSKGAFWKNRLTHIVLEPGARLTHIRMQDDSDKSVYTQTTNVHVGRDAVYDAVAYCAGAALSRNQIRVTLDDAGAQCHLNGANLLRGEQLGDTTILVEHRAPHCQSYQNIRTVLDGRAHGVFQGKVHVHQPAQKTDGYQLSRALILSEGAEMDTKPELEIYADDVKCSHGATTGQLDQEPLFYMQSRGIEQKAAKALLIQAFIAEVFDKVQDEGLKTSLERKVEAWLKL